MKEDVVEEEEEEAGHDEKKKREGTREREGKRRKYGSQREKRRKRKREKRREESDFRFLVIHRLRSLLSLNFMLPRTRFESKPRANLFNYQRPNHMTAANAPET